MNADEPLLRVGDRVRWSGTVGVVLRSLRNGKHEVRIAVPNGSFVRYEIDAADAELLPPAGPDNGFTDPFWSFRCETVKFANRDEAPYPYRALEPDEARIVWQMTTSDRTQRRADRQHCTAAMRIMGWSALNFVPAEHWKQRDFCLDALDTNASTGALEFIPRSQWRELAFCVEALQRNPSAADRIIAFQGHRVLEAVRESLSRRGAPESSA
jgi:hypothetical protein